MAQKHNSEYTEAPMTTFGPEQGPSKRYRRLRHPSFDADVWTAKNPLLQKGELGVETDTSKVKIGDGVTFWNDLPYMFDDAGANTDLSNLSATGKANVSAQGTYDASATYSAGTVGAAIKGKASTDLDNLTDTGKNIANWSSNVSNCITEIPQDINLTLSAGTLTLKTGSKCYLKTDTTTPSVTIASDLTTTQTTDGTYFAIYDGSALTTVLTTAYDYSTLPNTYSLPLAIVTVSSGAIKSIDQVFNGFGYIGSHAFALPGLKCLIPNGRNADGTLKNLTGVVSVVRVQDVSPVISNNRIIEIFNTGLIGRCQTLETNNDNYNIVDGTAVSYSVEICKVYTDSNGKITTFIPNKLFRAVDYSDTKYMAHQAMPSRRYTNLTLPATGGTITASADGYLTVNKSATAADQYINFINGSNGMNCNSIATSALPLRLYMPVSKGDVITINYDAAGTTNMFRFVYANGSK